MIPLVLFPLFMLRVWSGGAPPSDSLLTPNDLQPGIILEMETYVGRSLSGYINGGAELYHEYGFERLLCYRVRTGGIDFLVETYVMLDARAAFGVFSVSSLPCALRDSSLTFSCITPFQVQGAAGRVYFRIQNSRGSLIDQQYALRIARALARKVPSEDLDLPPYLADSAFSSCRDLVRCAQGPLGLQNGYPDLLDRLEGLGRYALTVLPCSAGGDELVVISLHCSRKADADALVSRFSSVYADQAASAPQVHNDRLYCWRVSPDDVVLAITSMDDAGAEPYVRAIRKAFPAAAETVSAHGSTQN